MPCVQSVHPQTKWVIYGFHNTLLNYQAMCLVSSVITCSSLICVLFLGYCSLFCLLMFLKHTNVRMYIYIYIHMHVSMLHWVVDWWYFIQLMCKPCIPPPHICQEHVYVCIDTYIYIYNVCVCIIILYLSMVWLAPDVWYVCASACECVRRVYT